MRGADDAAQRIRLLSDAVRDVGPVLAEGITFLRSHGGSIVIDTQARAAIIRVAIAMEELNRQLASVNGNIERISRNPLIMGLAGKTAESELQSLVTRVDAVREALREGIRLARP